MIQSTRLRYITASSKEELVQAVDSLPFKVEIKEIIMESKTAWTALFVIPETEGLEFLSMDLTKV